jgi:hypothetical protein
LFESADQFNLRQHVDHLYWRIRQLSDEQREEISQHVETLANSGDDDEHERA